MIPRPSLIAKQFFVCLLALAAAWTSGSGRSRNLHFLPLPPPGTNIRQEHNFASLRRPSPQLANSQALSLPTQTSGRERVFTVTANINGLAVTLDRDSGSIVRLRYAGIDMLESKPDRATILDLATPIPEFEPLRRASRFSHGAKIDVAKNVVTIHWDRLGMSRGWAKIEGEVCATVTLKGAPDGRSIVMACEVENRSKTPVRQVIFPDFGGLLPFAGAADTTFRTCAFGMQPFVQLAPSEESRVWHYVQPFSSYSVQYTSGGFHQSDMIVRWMDFGGLKGGLSLFPRRWGWDPELPVMLQHSEVEQKLRLMVLHAATINPGQRWESGEFWLTPHAGGWAKGIEPYRAWAKAHYKREWPVPKHVREGLGFRTVWMSQYQPADPKDPVYRFKDLPALARESKEHGLDELMFWSFRDDLQRPMPKPYPNIGTEQEMADAVAACRKIGVNAVPFIGVLLVGAEAAPRYGLRVTSDGAWTYHSELVPRTMSGYASQFASVQAGPAGAKWAEDIVDGCKHLIDLGVPSVCFDQFLNTNVPPPNMASVASEVRAYAKRRDPESTFSGEELRNWELDSNILDYTWNWGPYKGKDFRPLTSVFPSPRLNHCIDSSPLEAKKAFADNLYLCVMPRKPESTNGSASLASYPAFSKALKQCVALRKRFLPYFTHGTLIGDCLLSSPCSARVSSYVLPDRVLTIVVNDGAARSFTLSCDLAAWVRSGSGRYRATEFGEDGRSHGVVSTGGRWLGRTGRLGVGEMRLFEIRTAVGNAQ
ncbi:MAG: hypothetical protein ACHQ50_11205 [Fimbriimonadales bacterium]